MDRRRFGLGALGALAAYALAPTITEAAPRAVVSAEPREKPLAPVDVPHEAAAEAPIKVSQFYVRRRVYYRRPVRRVYVRRAYYRRPVRRVYYRRPVRVYRVF